MEEKMKTCELVQKFVADTQYPYGQCVLKNMETIRETSLSRWLDIQDKRWRCQSCGAAHSWYHETCFQCGQAVASYKVDVAYIEPGKQPFRPNGEFVWTKN